MDVRRRFGNAGESLAAEYLKSEGYVIVAKQRRTRFGEIDLVCLDGAEVVFVEVKSRRTKTFGSPEESVTREKIQRMARSAEWILREECWLERPWRLDVVAIEYDVDPPKITHIHEIDMPSDTW